jgi:hypothetical protein
MGMIYQKVERAFGLTEGIDSYNDVAKRQTSAGLAGTDLHRKQMLLFRPCCVTQYNFILGSMNGNAIIH